MPARSSLALFLRTVGALQLAAVLACLTWLGPRSPGWALVGAALIAGIAPIVLALEFVLLALVPAPDPAIPRPSTAQLLRAWGSEVHNLARVFYWRLPLRWRTPEDHLDPACAGRPGVVLVHGFVCNRGFWAPWMRRLRALGHPFVAVNLEPVFGTIDDYVPIVEAAVQRVTACSGMPPVLICHSMGGLAARAWLRARSDGSRRVSQVITIGSPHQGTWLGRFSHTPNGRQMRRGSAWLEQLARDEAGRVAPPFTCWFSNCDNIVFPVASARMHGADNRLLAGRAHVALAFDPALVEASLALVREPGASKSVTATQSDGTVPTPAAPS